MTNTERSLDGKTIALTGASGKLGRLLVPYLAKHGAQLRLFGRDAAALARIFPQHDCHHCADFGVAARGCDALVDLAVLNNDAKGDLKAFRAVNVDRFTALVGTARSIGIRRILAFSSTHALDPGNCSPYAISKAEAQEWARLDGGKDICWLVLPKLITAPEGSLSHTLWRWAAAIKPTIPANDALKAVHECLDNSNSSPVRRLVPDNGQNTLYRIASFLIDMAFVAFVILLIGWLMLLVTILIRLESRGPAIFAQPRVGKDERVFILYKFRTMRVGTRQAGTHEVSAAEVTRVGKWLRRLKIDELPQIFNIARRELSVVGPRPCLPVQQKLITERRNRGIYQIRPGLTGLAQINGVDMSNPVRLAQWDERYLQLRCLALDLRILVQTFLGRGGGDRTAN
ncbi:hybrid nucleoside-diphosphate sugar epimerase/sugar transferase [Sphingomicrobium lutaoense]|uniref:Lipopolysaccharide/colanic/teichoic acid biosynthesis glycosyltransferase n=1 Tax=Sphingomicrobium lutaoense TaxID=515949 RepID=A0A839YWD7_9SPHN|nr:hybrid nucleoside-diphosphate sugar epimerase/sugar transferase [Sphingomicrobium lutaoense]MBB3763509.1 lipopolysaccharide/colanic/teichoic acid biosynthesis glycosyltransferase [Sphingomicrobium lutaoense]